MKPDELNTASSLLEEVAELIKEAVECERMGSTTHAKGYVRWALEKLDAAEKALLNPSEIES